MINQIGVFIDKHHRVINAGLYVIGFTGFVIVIRNTHFLRVYRDIAAIPHRAIQQQHPLRGVVKSINKDNSLSVAHQPLLFRSILKARENELLNVRLAAVQPHRGFTEYLNENICGRKVKFTLLNQNRDVADAVLYSRGRWLLSRRGSVNEAVVRDGVAVVDTASPQELVRKDVYDNLSRKLLTVEVKADQKGKKGVWRRPSRLKICKEWISSWFR